MCGHSQETFFAVLSVPVIAELWTLWYIIQPNNKVNDFDLHFTIVKDQEKLFVHSTDRIWNGGHTQRSVSRAWKVSYCLEIWSFANKLTPWNPVNAAAERFDSTKR